MPFFEIIISPIKLILEIFFDVFYNIFDNSGISILGLSFVVTICCLPLYIIAEKWQEKDSADQKRLKPGIQRIKKTFKGDEQYMILSTYYKQNHYSPIYSLRSSFSLLIQIPFFMAAYSFLSNLEMIRGTSFLFINDLGSPDAIFKIGNFNINILPILMTIINCISGVIYSKGHPLREKIQIYVFAAIFLVILYNSPSGLVVYWTMNNVFSLIKNIFYKVKNPKKTIYITLCVSALICSVLLVANIIDISNSFKIILYFFFILIFTSPLWLKLFGIFYNKTINTFNLSKKQLSIIFLLSSGIIALTSGLYITSTLINSEPLDFCFIDNYNSPFNFLFITLFQSIGLYVFWPSCFFFLFGDNVKKVLAFIFSFFALNALINCFCFSGNYGSLLQTLVFRGTPDFFISYKACIINLIISVILIIAVYFIIKHKSIILNYSFYIIIFAISIISIKNCIEISNQYRKMEKEIAITKVEPKFNLSKNGKNLIVLFLDQCMSPMVKPCFEEDKNLAKQFDGFVFYPNTTSFAPMTMFGTPGLMGGYDYTPFEMNRRTDKDIQQKHNEAILSLPLLFSNNGYTATVSDPPYENYLEEPVTQMYTNYPQINRTTTKGLYSTYWYEQHNFKDCRLISKFIKRNFLMLNLFKMSPPYLRRIIYHDEFWNLDRDNYSFAAFIDNYSVLEYLPKLFKTDSKNNTYLFLCNDTTHEPVLLKKPEYIPTENKSDTKGLHSSDEAQYNSEMAAFKLLGTFFDYLKEQNVYDNTRIIIVSDHGNSSFKSPEFDPRSERIPFNKENLIATLLFKDFDSHNYNGNTTLPEDWTFMTNADTGTLATMNLIEDAKNPFTGLSYNLTNKLDYIKVTYPTPESTHNRHNLRFRVPDDEWYYVDTNIRKDEYWKRIDESIIKQELAGK